MDPLIYTKPELFDFNLSSAQGEGDGESCFIDCTSDAICPGDDDEI